MPWVAGVDGCRRGWYVVLAEFKGDRVQRVQGALFATFQELIRIKPSPAFIAIDIPIGLLDERVAGGRECDRLARKFLGRPRASSVFSPPIRKILSANRFSDVRGFGLTVQAFHILPKICEVDTVMKPALQKKIFEAHPEAAFKALSGRSMKHNKKTTRGREERVSLLSPIFQDLKKRLIQVKHSGFFQDDIVDAHALAVTAHRISQERGERFPENPPTDSRGLRMEIHC